MGCIMPTAATCSAEHCSAGQELLVILEQIVHRSPSKETMVEDDRGVIFGLGV